MPVDPLIYKAVIVGLGATVLLDLYTVALHRLAGVPATNWAMVGRWLGHLPSGKFVQLAIGQAAPVPGERLLGWVFHYAIGVGYGLLLALICGEPWFDAPRPWQPLGLAVGLLVLPYFVMMPGMGLGIAASRAPKPNAARLKSLTSHTVFGLGMYLTALLIAAVT